MKTKITSIVAIIFFGIGSALAQGSITEGMTPSIVSVNGLNVWGEYTQVQVISLLGTPTTYSDKVVVDEDSFSTRVQTYFYAEQTVFIFYDQRLVQFDIQTDPFSLDGFVKVGDPITKIDSFLQSIGSTNFDFKTSPTLGAYVDVFFTSGENGSIRFYYHGTASSGSIHRITFNTDFL
jgi:hypothetical protein